MGFAFGVHDEPEIEPHPADLAEAEALAAEPPGPLPLGLRAIGSSGALADLIDLDLSGAASSRHLWLGNLNSRLPRTVLRALFEQYGPLEDVVTFPGRMYAFVNFRCADDARAAAQVRFRLGMLLSAHRWPARKDTLYWRAVR